MYCWNIEGIFRLIQSIPSNKAEPFKRWLAKVGYERVQEIEDPELATKRTRALYKAKGYPDIYLELIIYWMKSAIDYTKDICVDYEEYYDDLTEAFKDGLKFAKQNKLLEQFYECFVELANSTEHIGWCTYDIMAEILAEYNKT